METDELWTDIRFVMNRLPAAAGIARTTFISWKRLRLSAPNS
ncbi:hypothetical protein FHT82_004437 [Rhizobium sp. BK275]|nr:hypothetical protein [Rhizobium sp. BK275]